MSGSIRPSIALGAALAIAALAGCERQSSGVSASTAPDASSQVINVPAAAPTGDPAGTTPVDGKQSELSKPSRNAAMPHEGDNNSFATTARKTPQRARGVDGQQVPERKQ